jgi:hypothetical protein
LKQKKLERWKKGAIMMTTMSRIRPKTQNKLLQLIESRSTIHPSRAPSIFFMLRGHGASVSDLKTAKKLRWLEPCMSEIHDNNRQIRPANQNMMSQLIEILSTIHPPRKTPSSSCSPWWSWCLKNEMRCVVSAANKHNSQPLNWLSHHNNQD